jgi:recombination protein RecA
MGDWKEEITKEFGGDVFLAGFSGDMVSTGSFVVDTLTGIGGFPLGGIVEVCGTEGSGKTTLALTAMVSALKSNRSVMWLDFERKLSSTYAKKLGVDFNAVKDYVLSPESMEDGWMMMNRFCEAPQHKGGMIFVDSVAAMPPMSDLEKVKQIIGQVRVASMAQVMSVAFRQMLNTLKKAQVGVVFLNQERSLIDTTGRSLGQKTTPGGAALKFYSSIRLKMEVRGAIKEPQTDPMSGVLADVVTGLEIQVTVLKNTLAPSFRKAKIVLRMDEGIDNLTSALKIAENVGWISKKGAYYVVTEKYSGGDTLGGHKEHGFERLRKFFLDNSDMAGILMKDVTDYLSSKSKSNLEEQ